MKWALAQKSKLGDVYHIALTDHSDAAWCSHRVKIMSLQYDKDPDGYLCGRCLNMRWQKQRKAPPHSPAETEQVKAD